MSKKCRECDRLWKAYAEATLQHVHLQLQQEKASLQHDRAKASVLSASVKAAERAWAKTRHEVQVHEAECYTPTPPGRPTKHRAKALSYRAARFLSTMGNRRRRSPREA